MGNPFFAHLFDPNNADAELYRAASNEICEMMGIDMFFLKRTLIKNDYILGEDVMSQFNGNSPITFYLENYEQYDGVGDIFSKFGFTPDNQLTLLVEMENFRTIAKTDEPLVSDLIWYPAGEKMFEIVHVDNKNGFYQFNHREYTFRIQCKLFEASHEDFDTTLTEIDELQDVDANNTNEADMVDLEKDEYLDLSIEDIFGNK